MKVKLERRISFSALYGSHPGDGPLPSAGFTSYSFTSFFFLSQALIDTWTSESDHHWNIIVILLGVLHFLCCTNKVWQIKLQYYFRNFFFLFFSSWLMQAPLGPSGKSAHHPSQLRQNWFSAKVVSGFRNSEFYSKHCHKADQENFLFKCLIIFFKCIDSLKLDRFDIRHLPEWNPIRPVKQWKVRFCVSRDLSEFLMFNLRAFIRLIRLIEKSTLSV